METNIPVNRLLVILCGKSQVGAGFGIFNAMFHNELSWLFIFVINSQVFSEKGNKSLYFTSETGNARQKNDYQAFYEKV
uniref:Uncharacterized protein n=1 Tax=Glossina pallidipes TaxID=7398 RepID=A0A1A9ZWK1_GLOPL